MKKRKSAEQILRELGVTEPREIDVDAIAYYCGAIVRYRLLNGCEARILGHGDRAVISVNSRASRERRRFSVGHEVGHWLNDRGKLGFLCKKEAVEEQKIFARDPESMANAFAADLLMPGYLFRPRTDGREMTIDTVEELAKEFDTSLTATAIRLVDQSAKPAMVVCHGHEGRIWFHPGPTIPTTLFPHKDLNPESMAFELLFSESPVARKTRKNIASAAVWIDRRDAGKYRIIEQSVRIADSAVLTMLWWKDTAEIDDAAE